jgi:Pyruvate/2-oxoacid:ferredoxin oxidoreductase delta subunit
VADLCERCAHRDPILAQLTDGGGLKIAACHSRAIKWLFAAAGAPLSPEATEVVNLRSGDPDALADRLLAEDLVPNLVPPSIAGKTSSPSLFPATAPAPPVFELLLYEGPGATPLTSDERFAVVQRLLIAGQNVRWGCEAPGAGHGQLLGRFTVASPTEVPGLGGEWELRDLAAEAEAAPESETKKTAPAAGRSSGPWLPWFPVIDYDRCTHCMQCLSFCLFGVFGVDEKQRIQVAAAESCKTNCPACSRVCPEAAIIFPKYASGPINGDVVSDADLQREKMKVDISALLGGDVYSLLRQRNARAQFRFSKERDANQALQERLRCLKELQESIEIPPEVLMSLPGPEEIQRRAREAAARAAAAREERAAADPAASPSSE